MECLIDSFSTQGRHLPTRRYPDVRKDRETGLWVVEDAAYRQSSVDQAAHAEYRGPWFTVRASQHNPTVGQQQRCHSPMFVRRYELLWRAENGRKWNSLGVFAGNNDETSEVAHSFAQIKGGLQARYLRVVPLECEGG